MCRKTAGMTPSSADCQGSTQIPTVGTHKYLSTPSFRVQGCQWLQTSGLLSIVATVTI